MVFKQKKIQGERPFRLVKFFTFSSLIVMFAATIAIAAFNAHWSTKLLQEKSEEFNQLLVENLNHQIFLRFVIPTVLQEGRIKLREEKQYKLIDKVVRSTLHSFNVDMVNIYDMDNIISYSFDKSRVGTRNAGGVEYEKAKRRESTSRLIKEGNFFEILLGMPNRTRIVTFAALKAEKQGGPPTLSGPVLGVIEIVQDTSEDYQKVARLQWLTVATCFCVMGTLFIVLRFVVKHGENILEKRAEERLRLEEKLRKAEHLSEIGEMTAGVSHEIRNPLGIIKSSAELLKKKVAKHGIDTNIPGIIVEESGRLDNIIKDFLDFAKPKNPDLLPCRVEDIVNKNLAFLTGRIEEKGIEVEKRFQKGLPKIMADSAMLYQAFLNIIINSFQAMKDNGKITIEIFHEPGNVVILFMDTGPGIKDKDLEKIWTPFYTTKDTGTGLGLGVVKNIIESHGGGIEISNRHASGVQVRIVLPV
ncbi:MAG: ATP-binding protein [Desulfobacteraceae bacterium]